MSSSRIVSFAGQTLTIEHHPEVKDLIDFLYQDVAVGDGAESTATLKVDMEGDYLVLIQSGQCVFNGDNEAELATALVRATIYCLIENNKDGLALHAAAVSKNGAGIVLPGRSGSGKSSVSSWFASRGFNYLTDEYVFLETNIKTIHAYRRPLHIKTPGLAAVEALIGISRDNEEIVRSDHVTMIPAHLINPDNQEEKAKISMVIFPRYQVDAELKLEKLSKAQAGLALMESIVNARNLEGHGFHEAARLVSDIPVYRLVYGSFEGFDTLLSGILPR